MIEGAQATMEQRFLRIVPPGFDFSPSGGAPATCASSCTRTAVTNQTFPSKRAGSNRDFFGPRIGDCCDGDTCTLDRDVLPGRNRVRVRGADTPKIQAH